MFRRNGSASLSHSFSMFQPGSLVTPSPDTGPGSSASLNTYKPPLFTSSCNSISEDNKVEAEYQKKLQLRRASTRRGPVSNRSMSIGGERRMERRTGSLVSQGSAEKNAGEDIAALLDRHQSTRTKPTRKPSIGQRFSSIASLTSQMAASMAAMSVTDIVASPLGQVEIEPNHIVDKLIPEIIYAATNNQLLSLPDMKVSGISLTGGKLTGLSNISRWGNAEIDTKNDKVVVSFSVAVIDLLAMYSWKRRKMKGLIKAGLCRTLLHIKIRQKLKGTTAQPELLDASLGSLETVQVTLCGLGPINFLVRRLVKDLVVQNIRGLLESQARQVIKNALNNFSMLDHFPHSSLSTKAT